MFILWLKTALFLLSLFVDSQKILRTCDLPGHAVSVLGQSACMNQNSAQVKNNSFFGLEKPHFPDPLLHLAKGIERLLWAMQAPCCIA